MRQLKWIQTVLLVVICLCGYAQTSSFFSPDSVKRNIQGAGITSALHIDGVLNEPEWHTVPAQSSFSQIEPVQGARPDHDTEIKMLFNQQYLYIGIFARDAEGRKALRAVDFKRDFSPNGHDHVMVCIDGFNDHRNAMCFAVNAYGVQRDYLSFDDLYFDYDWNGLWKVRTSRTDSGWYAEMAIPWQTLRYKRPDGDRPDWGINVYRNRRSTNETSAFSPFPRAFTASRMEYAGLLKNLQPPPPTSNIRLQPFVLTSYDKQHENDPVKNMDERHLKLGGDIKWAINPNNVMDLTFNTDFAQADADVQVNNLTQFSVFFPEKRQFFLENASLFSPGIQQSVDGAGGNMAIRPFFSRSIGLDDYGTPIPIVAGGRFVHRSASDNYGALLMRQQSNDVSPATNFFVGRYTKNLGEQNRVGSLVTVKNSETGTNTAATFDGFFRMGQSQSVNAIVTGTNTSNTGQNGFAGMVQYYNTTNVYKIWFTQSVISKNFDPQMGFVSRTDVVGTTPGINYYYRGKLVPFKKIIRAFEPGFLPEFYWQASTGKFIERSMGLFPLWFNFQSGAYLGYGITPMYKNLPESFSPLGVKIDPGAYNYVYHETWFATDQSKKLSVSGKLQWGGFYNGKFLSTDFKIQVSPIPHVSVLAKFNRNQFTKVGHNLEDKTVDLYTLQARFALNPRLQITGFYQRNALDHSDHYNIRFSWEYQPLSYFYVIYNHGRLVDLQHVNIGSEDHVIAKISFLKQL